MEIRFKAGKMLGKIKRLIPFTSPSSPDITIGVDNHFLTLNSNDPQLGTAWHKAHHDQSNISKIAEGDGSLPASVVYDFLRNLEEEDIVRFTIDGTTKKGTLRSSRNTAQYEVSGALEIVPTSFSSLESEPINMKASELQYILSKIVYIADSNGRVRAQNGIFIHPQQGEIHFVAMDNHRIGILSIPISMPDLVPSLLPVKFLEKILKLLTSCEGEDPVEIRLDGIKASITFGGMIYTTQVIDAKYPAYRSVIPKKDEPYTNFSLPTTELINCLHRISLVTGNQGSVTLDISSRHLNVLANNSEKGRNGIETLAISNNETDLRITFQSQSLLDILNSFSHGCNMLWYANYPGVYFTSDTERWLTFYQMTCVE
jgi:DNA polymerase-3 subunit beta